MLLAMKRRLREPSLLAPELAFARHEPLPEHLLEPDVVPALRVVLVILDEHVADGLRVREQHVRQVQHVEADDVPVVARPLHEQIERIAERFEHVPSDGQSTRTRRKRRHGSLLVIRT